MLGARLRKHPGTPFNHHLPGDSHLSFKLEVPGPLRHLVAFGAGAEEVFGNRVVGWLRPTAAPKAITAPSFTAMSSTASTLPYASSTAISVSGAGYVGTASTSALIVSNSAARLLKINVAGEVR